MISCAPRLLLASLILSTPVWAAGPSPEQLLKASDRARGGMEDGISWEVVIDSTEDGDTNSTSYKVLAKGNNALAQVTKPPRSKGEAFLFNDRTVWFHKPSLKKPVPIPARQKLSGQAANGDIASTNYARDYAGKIVGEEKVGNDACYVLELVAKPKQGNEDAEPTYDRIKYWISKDKKLGLKAEFQSIQGKPLKVASFQYGNVLKLGGKKYEFVSEMKIVDATNAKNYSVMSYSKPEPSNSIKDNTFSVNSLR